MIKSTFLLLLSVVLLSLACSRTTPEPAETPSPSERPTADDIRSQQPSLSQDEREVEEEAEPVFQPDVSHQTSTRPLVVTGAFNLMGTYTGTLPCANCAGIEHELSLYENPNTGERRYTLQRTWLGTRDGNQVQYDAGPWMEQVENGMRVLDLSYNHRDERIRFQVQSQRVIRLLDQQGMPIESELNYALYRLPN